MTKPKLISISGSVHSGKTTVSRILALRDPNAAYLDGDLIGQLVKMRNPDRQGIEPNLPDVHKLVIKIVKANLLVGTDVIIDYPFNDELRQKMLTGLKGIEFEAFWFLLKPDMQKVLKGSATRPDLNDWEIERVKYHYSSSLMETKMATVIDSTNQTAEETAVEITRCIEDVV